ncbi:MAG: hypothetical protein LW884_08580 [Bacteroidetes bacterium]|jgi:hypothetical protein|nr:hypothetical protein [Bacteroidota bacterium]
MMLVVLTAALSFLANYYFRDSMPWWIFAPVCAACGFLFARNTVHAFLAGFLGLFLLWGLVALGIDHFNGYRLGDKIAQLLSLPNNLTLVAATGLVGGLVGGFSTWAGRRIRAIL